MAPRICPRCQSPNLKTDTRCAQCGAPMKKMVRQPLMPDPDQGDFQVGDLINDRYQVLALIGRGGMGAIYHVQDTVLDEELALKVLLPYFIKEKEVVDRFINEVRITRKIAHPNIVRVHDFGKMKDSMFISMEYVNGCSLREILDELGPNERLPVRQCLHIINQLCIALKYAHRYTIHRDLKPDNVMIDNLNHIKLMDFGISKLKDSQHQPEDTGAVGTLNYMAPEQMQNLPDVDGRADIFSLGVLLYEMLTGKLPGAFPQPVSQLNKEASPALDAVIRKSLAAERERRYQDVSELREAIRPVIEGIELSSSPGITEPRETSSWEKSASPAPSGFAEAMGAFIQESHAGIPANAAGSSLFNISTPSFSAHDADAGAVLSSAPGLPPLDLNNLQSASDSVFESTPRVRPVQHHSSSSDLTKYALIIGAVLVAAAILFLVANHQSSSVEDPSANSAILFNRTPEEFNEGEGLMHAFEEAVRTYQFQATEPRLQMLNDMRDRLATDVEQRIYAKPFDMNKMNSASTDAAHAAQLDPDPRIRGLMETVTREIALFKFMLMNIDPQQQSATFRLNNPYYPQETQTLSEGDLLQERFIVRRILPKVVYLEDTHPKAQRRGLAARPMERIEAE